MKVVWDEVIRATFYASRDKENADASQLGESPTTAA